MQILRKIKRLIYLSLENLIKSIDRVYPRLKVISNPLSRIYGRLIFFLGDLCWLLRDLFRVQAYLAVDANWRIIFIGRENNRNDVEHLFFGSRKIDWRQVDQVYTWKKDRAVEKWHQEGVDLVVCETSRLMPFRSRGGDGFRSPILIRQTIILPNDAKQLLAGKTHKTDRRKIVAAEKLGYSYSTSKSRTDFDNFFQNLYLPYMAGRHGARAKLPPYEELLAVFEKGCLIQISDGNVVAAAALVYQQKDTVFMVEYGLNAFASEDKVQLALFTYWSTIRWAITQGAKKLDLGGTFAWVSNGVFHSKKVWKPIVSDYPIFHVVWDIHAGKLTPEAIEKLNEIEFVVQHKGGFYLLTAADQETYFAGQVEQQILSKAQRAGLNGVILMKTSFQKVIRLDSCQYSEGESLRVERMEDETIDAAL